MKKQYNTPEFAKVDIDTKDIMTLSTLLTTDDDDDNGENRDTFSWKW